MQFKNQYFYLSLISITLFSSCVSNKKFNEQLSRNASMSRQINDLKTDNESLKNRLHLMEAATNSANQAIDSTQNVLSERESEIANQNDKIKNQNEKLQQLQAAIDKQKAATETLRERVAKAMGNFNNDQLKVYSKNGKVYVSLSEKLLFASGSADVNEDGRKALEQLSIALNENKDIDIDIEGHTDTVPIKIKFQDNWALSTARATSIVRLLINNYHIDPSRLTASGRSQYEPIADNTTEEGRAQNRRTEIILTPKLDEIMKLIDSNTQ